MKHILAVKVAPNFAKKYNALRGAKSKNTLYN